MSSYSVDGNFAFIHVPKNAGTSVRSRLKKHYKIKDFDAIDEKIRVERKPYANHFPVWAIEKLLKDSGEYVPFKRMNKFMVVRNPWSRMVSLYFHRMRKLRMWYEGKPRNAPEDIEAAEKGFEHWLLHTPSKDDAYHTTTPQIDWGRDSRGIFVCDVIRMERIDRDWPALCKRLDLRCGPLPKQNTGQGQAQDYRAYYGDEARAHVEHHFSADMARWGYEF